MAETLENQPCPVCKTDSLTLSEEIKNIPKLGKVFVLGMDCTKCDFKQHDVEFEEEQKPVKITFEVSDEKDMKVVVMKSSQATLKIPYVLTQEPGMGSSGYVKTIEEILTEVKEQLENDAEAEEDASAKKSIKKTVKKVNRAMWGSEKLKIIIEDPSGNSAIVSDKAVKGKL